MSFRKQRLRTQRRVRKESLARQQRYNSLLIPRFMATGLIQYLQTVSIVRRRRGLFARRLTFHELPARTSLRQCAYCAWYTGASWYCLGHRVHANTEKSFPRINLVPSNLSTGRSSNPAWNWKNNRRKKKKKEKTNTLSIWSDFRPEITERRRRPVAIWLIVLYFMRKAIR